MPTVTVKMSSAEHLRLKTIAARRKTSKSAILREAFDKMDQSQTTRHDSLANRAAHLIGSLEGPGTLSDQSKAMEGYGKSHAR